MDPYLQWWTCPAYDRPFSPYNSGPRTYKAEVNNQPSVPLGVAEGIKWGNADESPENTTGGVNHGSANTHNNFNSTDKSGINSPQRVVLLRALQWSIFRIENSQWIGKCVDPDFAKAAKAGIASSPGSLQPQEVKSFYLAKMIIILTSINLFLFSVFANLFSWRAFELFLREEGYCIVSSIKGFWSLFVKFSKNRESSFKE